MQAAHILLFNPLNVSDIPPLPEGPLVSCMSIAAPRHPQIIFNIPEIERAREKVCFHLVLRCITVTPGVITCFKCVFCDHSHSDFVETLAPFFIALNYITFTFCAQILLNEFEPMLGGLREC